MTQEELAMDLLFWTMLGSVANAAMAIAVFIGLGGLYFAHSQLREARQQVISAKIWNKLHFTFTFLPNPLEFESIEKELDETIGLWKRKVTEPYGECEAKALAGVELADNDKQWMSRKYGEEWQNSWDVAGRKLKLYLNLIEVYCAAINAGVADSDTAKSMYAYKFRAHYQKLENYIKQVRVAKDDINIFFEFECVITKKWFPNEVADGIIKKY
jgi:hypothetical protein